MDAVSYSHSAKQAQRIEKFIENPDSNSGIVTVPKTIASSETITIPDGRVAVLPNVQVNGTLNVEGEVFIPSGAELSTVVQKSGDTMSGNLDFASGTKITGDFSNGTLANRTLLQTNITNGSTNVSAIPNGSSAISSFQAYNSSEASNCSLGWFGCTNTDVRIQSTVSGTGAYLPMTFFTSGAERMRIDTAGNVGIGTNNPASSKGKSVHIYNNTATGTVTDNTSLILESANRNSVISCRSNGNGSIQLLNLSGTPITQMNLQPDGSFVQVFGNGLGYGTGAGGTVTQLTSKNTAVTLNKPTGQIIMNNASLAAGAVVTFILQNSLIAITDTLCLNQKWGNENYRVQVQDILVGGARIQIENRSSVSQSEPIVLSFTVIKGATS